MSEYFRALKEMQRDELGATQAGARQVSAQDRQAQGSPSPSARGPWSWRALTPPSPATPLPTPAAPPAGPPGTVLSAAGAAYGTLFDNLRALANGRPIRVLVFASVAAEEPTRPVIAGLAADAVRRGRIVITADLTRSAGQSCMRACSFGLAQPATGADSLPLNFDQPDWRAAFERWVATVAAGADLVIIEGPPLGQSIDAALLARACDGLVIVARRGVTPRRTLQAAAERARTVGCRILGVVMSGPVSQVPRWLQRVIVAGAPDTANGFHIIE